MEDVCGAIFVKDISESVASSVAKCKECMVGWGTGARRSVIYGVGGDVVNGSRRIRYGGLFQFSAGGARLSIFACFWVALLVPRASRPLRVVSHGECRIRFNGLWMVVDRES
ncbi:hypothetical protein Trco_004211 [Trichoderma cornu-damae]|uniref:Uncharacterized protein n=1 Tax=Trichoderma cornu-damae TaxID=654480 RepID=A0A9P8TWW7_9HYPO|nr:hypothetical protein Trco_004211 [Trichoderma cornu-damae]